ncbi:MAG TPA: MtrB/PioB family outer membrane beta-barrel protein [Vicinamibacterales bacterium]|nr:MtrB/PioB family outer membrane beta-barrel protein [Vicinamibacterales bacterium]
MRRISVLVTLALGLVPIAAEAQSSNPPATTGAIDFGLRGTSVSGDGARYERYRDLGDGLAIEGVRLSRERLGWVFDFMADHAGRRDQRYRGDFVNPGKFKGWVTWDQIPMLMSRTTKTLFGCTLEDGRCESFAQPGTLAIDDAIQRQVQASPSASALPGLFETNSVEFDTRSRRHIFEGGFQYLATPELTVNANVRRTDRSGMIPYGGNFGHSSLVELPAPVEHNLTDVNAGAEFQRDRLLLRGGYTGSFFHNDVTSVTFDNPFRCSAASATASCGTLDIPGTPSAGRLSLPPSNSFIGVNGLASVRLPYRSRATAHVSLGTLKDAGDPLMPQTINPAITPGTLERGLVEGKARTTALNLNFVSRPNRYADVSVRFRSYDYDNQTPDFTLPQRVSYDNSSSATPGPATYSSLGGQASALNLVKTEPFGVLRHTFDADFKATPVTGATAGVGYSWIQEERSHRFFEATTDNVFRLSFDAVGNRWFAIRTKYEHAQKRDSATEEELDESQRELFMIGEQPGIRHFDIASRNRNRITILGGVTPMDTVSLNASIAVGKDDYLESLFGLRDNTHRVFSVGTDLAPSDLVTVSGSYSYEKYNALSRSRQASPPSGSAVFSYDTFLTLPQDSNLSPEVARASRNWASDGTDRVHSFIVTAGVAKIAEKVGLQFSYDFNRAHALYEYITGPVVDRTLPEEVIVEGTLDAPTPLPLVKSRLQRGTLDATYALTSRVSLGLSYWHERYDVTDFTLDAEANPNLARGSALLLGYLYRPYRANTVWGRLIYSW